MGRAIALTIAGSDSSGGAGIQADLKSFSALGVYGASVITALTAQNTRGVDDVSPVAPAFVTAQLSSVLSDLDVKAIKIGMLADAGIIHAVGDMLDRYSDIPVVLDPVMVATSGDRLLDVAAVSALKTRLIPCATVVTPNLAEAAVLLDLDEATDHEAMEMQGNRLLMTGARAVLMKGGHIGSGRACDVLVQPGRATWYDGERVDTPHTHGTGCTLSAAIAAGLATGLSLDTSISQAKTYLTEALKAGFALDVGKGHGPVDHLWMNDAGKI